jgi:arabinofuranosyltransferase
LKLLHGFFYFKPGGLIVVLTSLKQILVMNVTEEKYLRIKWILAPLIILYLIIVFITAWLSDDAYITFRSVDNFINGYGLTWNIGERVQAYTHPLWMFMLSGFYFLTRELYYTSMFLSIVISLLTFYVLLKKISISAGSSIVAGLILIFSKAFIDYSTSGLENPLTHLLIVLFFVVYFNTTNGKNKIFMLSFLSSIAALNRLDSIMIFLPALIFIYSKEKQKSKIILIVLAGFIPLFIWELFSLFYYGFPFPNTAYAKLSTGISIYELITAGLYYLLDSLYMDPLTFFTVIIGLAVTFLKRKHDLIPIAIGVVLYIIYVINIGGDFMSGRFLSAPLLCTVIIISRIEIKSAKTIFVYSSIIIGLGFLSPRPNLLSTPHYSLGPKIINAFRFGPTILGINEGITDERFWYYENTGLLNNLSEKKIERHPWVKNALTIKGTGTDFIVKATVGLYGFYTGRDVHIVDQYALTEPLLARLPSTEYWLIGKEKPKDAKFWRIGHFARKIPEEYLETLKTGKNKIVHQSLAKYYEKLSIIIKGNLWDFNRLKEIYNFNTGKYDYLIEEYSKTLSIKQ